MLAQSTSGEMGDIRANLFYVSLCLSLTRIYKQPKREGNTNTQTMFADQEKQRRGGHYGWVECLVSLWEVAQRGPHKPHISK